MAITKNDGTKILDVASVGGNSSTALSDCTAVEMSIDTTLALTAVVNFDGAATEDVRIHVRSSYDGTNYDDVDIGSNQQGNWDVPVNAGSEVQSTANEWTDPKYIKVIVENLDSNATGQVQVYATTQEVSATA